MAMIRMMGIETDLNMMSSTMAMAMQEASFTVRLSVVVTERMS